MCRAQDEHGVLLQALLQRDVVRAEALMAEHIYQSAPGRRPGNPRERAGFAGVFPGSCAGPIQSFETTGEFMKLVKIEASGRNAEGVLDGDTVHIVGGWRDGPAGEAGFSLTARWNEDIQRRRDAATERVALSAVKLAVPVDPLPQDHLRRR